MANAPAETIDVYPGPNFNQLGIREARTYGHATRADLEKRNAETSTQLGFGIDGYRLAMTGVAAKVGVNPTA